MVCFNPPYDGITKTERLHFCQKKSVVDGVKGFGKIKIDDISCGAFAHQARHRKLEEQQIGGDRTSVVKNHANVVQLPVFH